MKPLCPDDTNCTAGFRSCSLQLLRRVEPKGHTVPNWGLKSYPHPLGLSAQSLLSFWDSSPSPSPVPGLWARTQSPVPAG